MESININCCLCLKPAILKYKNYPGYQIPSAFEIFYCPSCNTSFSMPRTETNEVYELIYKNGPNVRWYERYWKYAKVVKNETKPLSYLANSEDTYWAVKQSLNQITKDSIVCPRILEIGCGLGYLTYSLNKEGYNTTGLDISKEAISNAKQNYGDYYIWGDLHEYSSSHANEYDIIIFTEVIEHLHDITTFMQSLLKLLKPGGKIILTTPNKSFYPNEVIWATDLPPVHCWWLSEDSINYIAKKLNLTASFLSFKKYYSKKIFWVNVKHIAVPITSPVFDEMGNLLFYSMMLNTKENFVKRLFKIARVFKFIYLKFQNLLGLKRKKFLIPKSRGPILCAILKLN